MGKLFLFRALCRLNVLLNKTFIPGLRPEFLGLA